MIRSVQWSPLWGSDGALILALTSGTLHSNLGKERKSLGLVSEIICNLKSDADLGKT